jgi:multidrug efflux pump subunit AcrA (membrane-fusion protein)
VYVGSLDEVFTGTITAFSPIPSLGTLTYPLTITMDPSEELFAGMFAEVRLVSDQVQNALCIPSEAVIIKNGIPVVVVLDAEYVPEFKEITIGIDNGNNVEILSGLAEGDVVVYSGQHYVIPGVLVNVAED